MIPCASLLPGHVVLGKGLRLQVGARPLYDSVRLRVLSAAHGPAPSATLTLHPVQWIVPAEARGWRDEGEGEEDEARAFLEGGLGHTEEMREQQQGADGEQAAVGSRRQQQVMAALQEWIVAEAARIGSSDSSSDVVLADGTLLCLRVGQQEDTALEKDKTHQTFLLAVHPSSLPGAPPPNPPLYVAPNSSSAPPTLLLGPRPVPRAWLVDDPLNLGLHAPASPSTGSNSSIGGRDAELARCRAYLSSTLDPLAAAARVAAGVSPPGVLLVHGQPVSGKTALCRALAAECARAWGTAAVWVDCAGLRGGKMAAVLSALTEAVQRARAAAPALLVLDGLDALAPAENEDAGDANLQAAEIAEHVVGLLRAQRAWVGDAEAALARAGVGAGGSMARLLVRGREEEGVSSMESSSAWALLEAAAVAGAVAVVVIARGSGEVHASLRRPGGIEALVEVPPLDTKGRVAVLRALLRKHLGWEEQGEPGGGQVDLVALSARLEGCTPTDLELLVARILHASAARRLDCSGRSTRRRKHPPLAPTPTAPSLSPQVVEEALDGFAPAALRNAKLATSDTTWADVGGLHAVKEEIRDVLEMPVRFAPLYSRLPTRLPTGLLLYGPPGCGKTLLAGAVARECGLSFISVKGPEVLDKYIGASEQAVRALFARAGAAAPCVLFFDEFEALAPRRGNDNTGVTDRVVNQLLTFLDGVEGRSGVYVMGATSRPDMVDPALLRPGRLDRQLYLGFPDARERAAILCALSRRMALTPEAQGLLPAVAEAEGAELLTGADLQALLSTAQLNAVHEALRGGGLGAGAAVKVTGRHVWEALETT